MRRPNRNIEIFSLSVLDLFSAAMGAFIIIALVLFPYYLRNKDAKVELEAAKNKINQCLADNGKLDAQLKDAEARTATLQGQLKDARADAQSARSQAAEGSQVAKDLKTCLAESASTFIVAVMRWPDEGYDVDLHVVDGQGRVFYYNNQKIGEAELSYDNKRGPGIEIWQNPKATAGNYCVAFHLFDYSALLHPEPAVKTDGRVFFRNGATDIAAVVLTKANPYVKVGTIELTADGKFAFHAGTWACAEEPDKIHAPPPGKLDVKGSKRLLQ